MTLIKNFMFATVVKCSYPTVANGRRHDQLAEMLHYKHWRQDFQLCRDVRATVANGRCAELPQKMLG